ncbi:metallophosphoesterase [Planotetraspora phitsanulokensis]|uniref:Metallophosphoesterase n=1 Tax=Planotetraspora phitsanulokensis TaxID=575192 RepID=A0A8J3XC36_9ACTN|nr:metallophosphoesterase [Planotetraspora phitsanulokensis]GII35271.1 metallophosphoesterase [Planotetraspora phitsanulokensis]
MRVHVVSDVHGRVDALARAGDGADALVCLGDLILFVDYQDHSQGIFADLFGPEKATEFIGLRTAGRFDDARAMSTALWSELGGDPRGHIESAVRKQYEQIFAAMPEPAYLTYGNVDLPLLWKDYLRAGHQVLDGTKVEIGGLTFGFVGGGLRTRYRTPYEIDDEDYARKVEAVGQVDVLCCHIPPAVPELLYDVVARRFERGSEATLEAIKATQPRYALFGHVHQPLVSRTRIGRTECVNVGHFRGRGTPFALEW